MRDKRVAKLAYMILKDAGICVRCLANWTHKRALCDDCAKYWRVKSSRKKLFLVKKQGA